MLSSLMEQGQERMNVLENTYPLKNIAYSMDRLPSGCIANAITDYQKLVRNNEWFFPTLKESRIDLFLARWGEVHESYFKLAEEIYDTLMETLSLDSLATHDILTRAIQSETMRAWVGKRSPSGLDAMLASREEQLRELLTALDDDDVEDVLFYGGIYIGDPAFVTAERETINHLANYHQQVGRDLTLDMLDGLDESSKGLLRDYCKYSLVDFNQKYHAFRTSLGQKRAEVSSDEAIMIVEKKLDDMTNDNRAQINALLEEVKILNHLNLNLEVKYSFKGWAGLMHTLVFNACSAATSIDIGNVYIMCEALKK